MRKETHQSAPVMAMADGATGFLPSGWNSGWLARPTCHSCKGENTIACHHQRTSCVRHTHALRTARTWQKMEAPLSCTACVTGFHPSICRIV